MKRNDIKPRTILAYRNGTCGATRPVTVIDTATLWELLSTRSGRKFSTTKATRPSSSSIGFSGHRETGYLAIFVGYGNNPKTDHYSEIHMALSLVPEDGLTEENVNKIVDDLPDSVHLTVVNNRHLIGDYDKVKQQEDLEQQRLQHRQREEGQRRASNHRYLAAIQEELANRGDIGAIETEYGNAESVRISIDVLGKLLDVQRPGNQEI